MTPHDEGPPAPPAGYAHPWQWMQPPWIAQQAMAPPNWVMGGQVPSIPYPAAWLLPCAPHTGPPSLEVMPESAARASRRQKCKEYDSGVTVRDAVGQKPQQVRVKPGGDIDAASEGKNAWNSAVRTFVPRMLDISIVDWDSHKPESLKKLRDALDCEFEYVGNPLSMVGFRNAIKKFLKTERSRLKARYMARQTKCPINVQPQQWECLKEYWGTDNHVAKTAKMVSARKQVNFFSRVGRKGRVGKESMLVSALLNLLYLEVCEVFFLFVIRMRGRGGI
jgi:hypothetical protein